VTGTGSVVGVYQGYVFNNGMLFSGMLCDVGAAGPHQPQTFNGTYLSRNPLYATSEGSLVWSDNGNGKILASAKGNLKR
jgi:hypothetical protein